MRRPMDKHRIGIRAKARLASFVACIALLTGCSSDIVTPATVLMASAAVVINEDKTPGDILASAVTGQDCDTIRKSRDKGPLCRPPQEEVIEAPVYCYRTLGKIDCFRSPDPYGYDQPEVN